MHFASYTSNNGRVVVLLSSLLLIFSLAGISKLTVENRFIDYFKESTEIYQGMELLDLKLGGTAPLDIVLEAPKEFFEETSGFDEDFEDDFGFDESQVNGYWWNIINIKHICLKRTIFLRSPFK